MFTASSRFRSVSLFHLYTLVQQKPYDTMPHTSSFVDSSQIIVWDKLPRVETIIYSRVIWYPLARLSHINQNITANAFFKTGSSISVEPSEAKSFYHFYETLCFISICVANSPHNCWSLAKASLCTSQERVNLTTHDQGESKTCLAKNSQNQFSSAILCHERAWK